MVDVNYVETNYAILSVRRLRCCTLKIALLLLADMRNTTLSNYPAVVIVPHLPYPEFAEG
jgi:hypothetical protein